MLPQPAGTRAEPRRASISLASAAAAATTNMAPARHVSRRLLMQVIFNIKCVS